MVETRFTLGPWKVTAPDNQSDDSNRYHYAEIRSANPEAFNEWGLMADYRGPIVAYVACNPAVRGQAEEATIQGNADLLSAASSLYAALLALADTSGGNPCWCVGSLHRPENRRCAQAQDAVAQARGEASE